MRRLLLKPITINSLFALEPELVPPYANQTDFAYHLKITLTGTDYYYSSNHPFYVLRENDGYYICADNNVWRNGQKYGYVNVKIGSKNGITYYRESYLRTIDTYSTISSNEPITLY